MVMLSFRQFARLSAAVLLSVLVLFSSVAWCAHREGQLLVRYKPERRMEVLSSAGAAGARLMRSIDALRLHQLRLPPGMSVDQAVKRFRSDPNVEYAGPNHIIRICRHPNDDIYVNGLLFAFTQWGLYDPMVPDAGIDAPEAWDVTTGSSDVIIAVTDTGVDSTHEDLDAKIVPGINMVQSEIPYDPNDTHDDNGHGTFVAGVAAAETNNYIGIAGVSWGARIMPVKIIGASGEGDEADAAAGITWAADHGAHVINMSWGTDIDAEAIRLAIAYAYQRGCVLVAASGNEGVSTPFYPAAYDEVIAVGASNEAMERCTAADWGEGGSNYGSYLDVMAPGNWIVSTTIPDQGLWGPYTVSAGTSAAAPFVSGTAALLLSIHGEWTNAQIATQIKTTCKDIADPGWDQYTGWGVVSARDAVVQGSLPPRYLGELNNLSGGTLVRITDAVITSGSTDIPDRFYIEQMDRACGTMLPFTTRPLGFAEGDVVEVLGTVMTVNGERAIVGASLTKTGTIPPLKPFAMRNKAVGGGRNGWKSGITNGFGTNNIGLLVTVFGRVTAVGWTYFYVDDGSGAVDGSGMCGLKVISRQLTKPQQGDYVRVTGIVSVEQPPDAGTSIPVVRVRRQSDIETIH